MQYERTPRWLLYHAARIAAILAVGYSVAWVVGTFFTAVLVVEWIPHEGIVGVVRQVSQLLAVLYVVSAGTASGESSVDRGNA